MSLSGNIKDADFKDMLPDQTCRRYTLSEIQSATDNFDESLVIGRGGFGKVYKCSSEILSVMEVAVKRLTSMSKQGACEFDAEVKVLSNLRHGNLVSLIGYCNEENEMILVYEFMPNGTLEDHLQRAADTNFRWLRRLKICIGAARGLDYLHTGPSTQHGVIHRDVKTSNILLDANFNAKISDFGLAKVSPINQTITFVNTQVKGTFGYMDPSYFFSGKLTRKSDVYAFGVVLFEVLSGRQAVDPTLDEGLATWAQTQIKEGKLNQIIDSRLTGQISKKCLKEFASIACRCLHNDPKRRPTMAEVTLKLESVLSKEKESADFYIYEGRFISIIRNFFTSRTDMIPGHEEAKKSETSLFTSKTDMMPGYEAARKSGTSGFRSFTFDETRKRTYDPTKTSVGLEVHIRKRHIGKFKLDLKPEEFIHPNLVKLLQYHLNDGELSCVYEFTPDPSLDQLLFEGTTSLSWVARLKIAVGAARGLSFLHQRRHPAYSQFKTTCILVDKDYNARLWDYEVDDSVVTLGSYSFQMDAAYAAPEWFSFQADVKLEGYSLHSNQDGFGVMSEVYAFGVVLLEILTGMNVLDYERPDGKQNLVKWATPLLVDEVNLGRIIDPKLLDNSHPPKGAFKFALLVANCLQKNEDKRPSMYKISEILSQFL